MQILPIVSITKPGKLLQEIKQQLPVLERKRSNQQHMPEQPEKALGSGNEGEVQCPWVLAISGLAST